MNTENNLGNNDVVKVALLFEENKKGPVEAIAAYDNGVTRHILDEDVYLPIIAGLVGGSISDESIIAHKNIFSSFKKDQEVEINIWKAKHLKDYTTVSLDNDLTNNPEVEFNDESLSKEKHSSGKKTKKVVKRVAILVSVALIGLAGYEIYKLVRNQKDKTKPDGKGSSITIITDDILDKMTSEERILFESTYNFAEKYNAQAEKEGNFHLDIDGDNFLYIDAEKALDINILVNKYDGSRLFNSIGNTNKNSVDVIENARQYYAESSLYNMNATELSALADIVEEPKAKNFILKHQKPFLEYNKNPSRENADKIIKNLYYDYTLAGVDGGYNQIDNPFVAWLVSSYYVGFERKNKSFTEHLTVSAVSEEEKAKYGDLVIPVGTKLNELTESELLSGNNNELTLIEELDDKSLCSIVVKQIESTMDDYNDAKEGYKIDIITDARIDLSNKVREEKGNDLANRVVSTMVLSDEIINQIKDNYGAKGVKWLEEYKARVDFSTDYEDYISKLDSKLKIESKAKKYDRPTLVNNRTKQLEKKQTGVYDSKKLEAMSESEKKQVIKDEGKITVNKTTITSKKANKDDLTDAEKTKVEKEKAQKEKDIAYGKENSYMMGKKSANEYLNSGSYSYKGTVTRNFDKQKVNMSGRTLFDTAVQVSAYTGKTITSGDSQIQQKLVSDAKKFQSESKSAYVSSYKAGWIDQMNARLAAAAKKGKTEYSDAKKIYEKTLKEIEELEKQATQEKNKNNSTNNNNDSKPTTPSEDKDPMTNPDYHGGEEEIPYVPTSNNFGNNFSTSAFYGYIDQTPLEFGIDDTIKEVSSSGGKSLVKSLYLK